MSDLVKLLKREPFVRFSRRYLALVAKGELTPGELVVLLAVADKTISWQRLWLEASYTDLEALTGMTRKGLVSVVKRLLENDLLVRKPIGRTFTYALVPSSMTGAQVLAACDVDSAGEMVTSGNGHRIPQVTDQGSYSYSSSKKTSKKASGHVDKGMKAKANGDCHRCQGQGWLVLTEPDGFTESVTRCPCTA